MIKALDATEHFFGRFVPSPLKRHYSVGFRYSVFAFGGLIGYVIYYGAQRILFDLGIWRGIALAVGIILAILFTFTYHRHVTFDQKTGWKEKFVKFIPIQLVIGGLNWVISLVAIETFHFPDLPATFVITLVLSILNFAASRVFVFNKAK